MDKKSVNNVVLYVMGLFLLSLGVVLAIKSNYGISAAVSIPFVISSKYSIVSLGTFNYIYQGIIFLILVLIMRKISIQYVLAFVTAVLFGYAIDFWNYLLKDITAMQSYIRVPLMIVSILISAVALMLFIKSKLPMLPYDLFTEQVATKFNLNFGRFKTSIDVALVGLSITLSIVFFGQIVGIGIGTVGAALAIGLCVNMTMKVFDQYFEVVITEKSQMIIIKNEV